MIVYCSEKSAFSVTISVTAMSENMKLPLGKASKASFEEELTRKMK